MPDDDPPTRPTLVDLDVERCLALVGRTPVGRLGFTTEDGDPMILPVNHLLVDGIVHVRTKAGTKLSDDVDRRTWLRSDPTEITGRGIATPTG